MGNFKKVILIDLDGVLNEYNGNFCKDHIPNAKCGVQLFLKKLVDSDYEIKIFTTRNRLLTSKWLIANELDEYISDVTNVKDPCYLFVDDRCVCFNGDFDELKYKIDNFKVWWKIKA